MRRLFAGHKSSDIKQESDKMLPESHVTPYGPPELWAKSTMEPHNPENLLLVFEVRQGGYISREMVRQRMWLHEILDDNSIPYYVQFGGFWATRKQYLDLQHIYVDKDSGAIVQRLINEYNDPDNFIEDPDEDEELFEITEHGILRIKCPFCGEGIDFDHHKCPHCKAQL